MNINPAVKPFLDDLAHLLAKTYLRDRGRRGRLKLAVRAYIWKKARAEEEVA